MHCTSYIATKIKQEEAITLKEHLKDFLKYKPQKMDQEFQHPKLVLGYASFLKGEGTKAFSPW